MFYLVQKTVIVSLNMFFSEPYMSVTLILPFKTNINSKEILFRETVLIKIVFLHAKCIFRFIIVERKEFTVK